MGGNSWLYFTHVLMQLNALNGTHSQNELKVQISWTKPHSFNGMTTVTTNEWAHVELHSSNSFKFKSKLQWIIRINLTWCFEIRKSTIITKVKVLKFWGFIKIEVIKIAHKLQNVNLLSCNSLRTVQNDHRFNF